MDAEILALTSAADGLAVTVGRIPRASLEIDMHDIPLTLRDLVGAIVIGLALGALIACGL